MRGSSSYWWINQFSRPEHVSGAWASKKLLRAPTYFCNSRSPLRSRSATSCSALRSAPLHRFSATPAHRSAPPDFRLALLRFPLRSRSAHAPLTRCVRGSVFWRQFCITYFSELGCDLYQIWGEASNAHFMFHFVASFRNHSALKLTAVEIYAKFITFWPCKVREGVGEMPESQFQVHAGYQPPTYFRCKSLRAGRFNIILWPISGFTAWFSELGSDSDRTSYIEFEKIISHSRSQRGLQILHVLLRFETTAPRRPNLGHVSQYFTGFRLV